MKYSHVGIGLGLGLLFVLGGNQVAARSESICEVARLVAAKSYVGCLVREIRRDSQDDLGHCYSRLVRKLARADCGSADEATALGDRLWAALESVSGAASGDGAHYTPVVMSVLAPPHPVTGSDARTHLVYEIQLVNASPAAWVIETVEVLDGDDPDSVLLAIEGDEVAAKVQSLGDGSALSSLTPGQSALAFIHVPLEPDADVPSSLDHRLTLSLPGGIPEALRVFAGLPPDAEVLEELDGHTTVARGTPAVLGPPLLGDGWVAADGCCVAPLHIRAALAINGELTIAQRFAIDWERLNDENRLYVGERGELESYFAYGAPALAVADARVSRVVDGLEEQVPGALPSVIALDEADGNHVVLDLGDGRFALYAHLIPDSITVAEGERVRRGDVLGLVGNSGNTLVPHLHFHVMSTPSGLASNGLPYVIDGYELVGHAPSTAAFEEAEASGEPLGVLPADIPGAHANDLPLDLSVVQFSSR